MSAKRLVQMGKTEVVTAKDVYTYHSFLAGLRDFVLLLTALALASAAFCNKIKAFCLTDPAHEVDESSPLITYDQTSRCRRMHKLPSAAQADAFIHVTVPLAQQMPKVGEKGRWWSALLP